MIRQTIKLHRERNSFEVNIFIEESGIISAGVRRGKARHSAIHREWSEVLCRVRFSASNVYIESLCVGQNEETQTELKASSIWMEKVKVRVGENVIKLREEREFLGRFLIIPAKFSAKTLDIKALDIRGI